MCYCAGLLCCHSCLRAKLRFKCSPLYCVIYLPGLNRWKTDDGISSPTAKRSLILVYSLNVSCWRNHLSAFRITQPLSEVQNGSLLTAFGYNLDTSHSQRSLGQFNYCFFRDEGKVLELLGSSSQSIFVQSIYTNAFS